MRASSVTLPLLALLAAGCERMPEDPVFIYGDVRHADGSRAGGTPLRLDRALGTLDNYSGGGEEQTWDYQPYAQGTTESSGSFTLEARAGDTFLEGWIEEGGYYGAVQHRFRVYPPLDADGNGVFVAFTFDDDAELPSLKTWASGLAVGPGPSLTFNPLPPAPETPPSATVPQISIGDGGPVPVGPSTPEPVLQLHGVDGRVWQQERISAPWPLSPYVLEDFRGVEAQVRGVSTGEWYFQPLAAEPSTLTFRQEWRSPRVALPAGTLRPVSRGMRCSPAPVDLPCPFTDGKLAPVELRESGAPEGGQPGVESLTVVIPDPVRLRRVVVRDLAGTLGYLERIRVVLEGSVDTGAWVPLGSFTVVNFDPDDLGRQVYYSLSGTDTDSPFDGPLGLYTRQVFLDAPLTGETPVRYVRLKLTSEDGSLTGRLWTLGELSLFE